VRGRDVVAGSGLFRAIAYYTPFGSSTGAATGAGARAATVVTGAGAAVPVQALAATGAAVPAGSTAGVGAPLVSGVAQTTAPVLGGETGAAAPAVGSLAQAGNPIVAAVVAPAAPLANGVAASVAPVAELAGTITAPALESVAPAVEVLTPLVNAAAPAVHPALVATDSVIQPVVVATEPALDAAGTVLTFADPLLPLLPEELTDPVVDRAGAVVDDLPAAPESDAQAATGNAVSAVRDTAAVTTSAVQDTTELADPVLPADPVGTASRVVARAEQVTGSAQPAAVDPTLPTRVLSSQGADAPDATTPQTAAQAEPATEEPLRIVAPLDDPEPSAKPRTAPPRIVGPESSDGTRAESEPDAPAPGRTPTADALTDMAGALLDR
jgi:hypothetical protein